MNYVIKLLSSLLASGAFFYVLMSIVPKFRVESGSKRWFTFGFLVVFLYLYDGRNITHVLMLYLSIMLILRGFYRNSTFVSSVGALFLYIIILLSDMITANISIMLFRNAYDFRTTVQHADFSSLLIFMIVVFILTQYYMRAFQIFKKISHLNRKLERILVVCNILVFSFIIAYHRMAFSNLIEIKSVGVFQNETGKAVCFYMLSSYCLVTILTFIVVALLNRLFVVDFSMENYKFKAETDLMTGTLSREAGLNHLKMEMAQSVMNGTELTIAYVDINDLKKVNDIQGHKIGDMMIKTVTSIINDNLRNRDEITRLGGDEFLVVFKKCSLEQAAKGWMRINENFTLINQSHQYPFPLSVSVGFAQYDALKHKDMMQFLHEADENMYAYKKRYKQKTL